ncbi:MAG: molybdopterin-dependent oxidoreductase, partial [Gammaproteobacteria bacterium]|nr:molybdopterin-dependent oxidoreductase [Gammaproteobacteria bacterium]
QKLLRALGCDHIDHRLRQQDFTEQKNDPVLPVLGQTVAELEQLDAALLIGSCIRKDQPIAAHRLRKAVLNKSCRIMALNAIDYDFNFPLTESIVTAPANMVVELTSIAKALLSLTGSSAPAGLDALLDKVEVKATHTAMAQNLKEANKASVLIGTQAMAQPELSSLRALANLIAELSGATLGYLTEGSNTVGAWLAGAIPHRGAAGRAIDSNAQAEVGYDLKAYINLNVEPEFDCASPAAALDAQISADFVVNLTTHVSDTMKAYADVLLPVATFAETSGTYVNAAAEWQSFTGSVEPAGEARPAWKVLRVLGNLFEVDGFNYVTSEEVRDELATMTADMTVTARSEWRCPSMPAKPLNALQRIGHLPIYAVDMLVRRAQPLQKTGDVISAGIYVNTATAAQANLVEAEKAMAIQGNYNVILPVIIDDAIPDNCVMIPAALVASTKLGPTYGSIEIKKQ